jgi:hypothetical protein
MGRNGSGSNVPLMQRRPARRLDHRVYLPRAVRSSVAAEGILLRGFWLKSRTGKNKDESSIAVAVDSVFAPGFSNQKPFTEMLMHPPQTEKRQPRFEAEGQDNTDRLSAPRQLTEPTLQAMPTAGARHFLLTFLLPSGQKVRRLSGRDPTVLSRQHKESRV